VQIRAGEDLRIVDANDTGKEISVTVSQDTNAGEVSIPVQEVKTQKTFQIGSDIIVEGSLFTAYNSVDPTKVQLGVERKDAADSIGLLGIAISNTATSVTTVSLQQIDFPVVLKDNQRLIIKNRRGENQVLTVNGDQTFSSLTGTLLVDAFNSNHIYESTTTVIYEPAYESSSRITLLNDSITIIASNVSSLSSSVASLSLDVSNAQSQISILSSFDTEVSNALAGINVTTNALSASVNTSVQYNDTGAYIQLLAGPAGSEIELQANQINIDGVVTFINDSATTTIDGDRITTGTITAAQINVGDLFAQTIDVEGSISGNYVANTSGWLINSNGDAEFNQGFFRNGTVSGGSIQDGATLTNLGITGTLEMGSSGKITNSDSDFAIRQDGFVLKYIDADPYSDDSAITFNGPDDINGSIQSRIYADSDDGLTLSSGKVSLLTSGGTGDIIVTGKLSQSGSDFSATNITSVLSTNRVGINDASPSYSLDVNGTFRTTSTSLFNDSISQQFSTTNKSILQSKDSNNDGIQIGIGGSGDFYMAPIDNNSANFSRELRWQPASDYWQVDDDLHVGGDITYVGTITDVSDSLLKENVVPLGSTIDKVVQLEAKVYDLVGDDTTREIGLFAQDVEALFPELVTDRQLSDDEGNITNYKSLSYIQMIPILLESIKDLKQEVEQLKQQINPT